MRKRSLPDDARAQRPRATAAHADRCPRGAAPLPSMAAATVSSAAAAVPTPPVDQLVGSTRRHAEWHGMERALSQTERTMERLANEKAWRKQERAAVSGSLYAATKPRRVNKPALKLPEGKRPDIHDVGISSSATSAATFKAKKAAREAERTKTVAELSIHGEFVYSSIPARD